MRVSSVQRGIIRVWCSPTSLLLLPVLLLVLLHMAAVQYSAVQCARVLFPVAFSARSCGDVTPMGCTRCVVVQGM